MEYNKEENFATRKALKFMILMFLDPVTVSTKDLIFMRTRLKFFKDMKKITERMFKGLPFLSSLTVHMVNIQCPLVIKSTSYTLIPKKHENFISKFLVSSTHIFRMLLSELSMVFQTLRASLLTIIRFFTFTSYTFHCLPSGMDRTSSYLSDVTVGKSRYHSDLYDKSKYRI